MASDVPMPPADEMTDAAAAAPSDPVGGAGEVPVATDSRHQRPVRSFVLRAGRMGTGQIRALEELAPRFRLPYQAQLQDWDAHFGRQAPRVLEIGFGMGQATAQIAAARPELDFIGVEVHEPGVGSLLKMIGEGGLGNVRIVQHDAVEVLRDMVAPGSLAGLHIYFPDPWHKKRHHKRRLIQPDFVAFLATRLAPGGWLHCATDWQDYAVQMLEVLGGCPALENTAAPGSDGYVPRPEMRPLTRFEARGLRLGHGVWDLVFRRKAD
ncbi:MAG: tRNA ((7)-)-methyltransferase [Pseudomonadota bacterium]|jgi:tRNA (guanine-N7-)-methyltransferase|uniref:tRNA (guanine-N(7)-)-methyltransferase n=1 Tax=Pseudaquabacterium rugosum TaxID=2984194 RepID=A0ABU9BC63_9BURK